MSNFGLITKAKDHTKTKKIHLLQEDSFKTWLDAQPAPVQNWFAENDFKGKKHDHISIPNKEGKVDDIIAILDKSNNLYALSALAKESKGTFELSHEYVDLTADDVTQICLGWALGCYHFDKYKKSPSINQAELIIPEEANELKITSLAEAVYKVRDLVNTPPNDMMPQNLQEEMEDLAARFDAELKVILDDQLVEQDYHAVYAVGKGSQNRPRVLDLTWGHAHHPKVTLVGKGVCFDTGGYNIKSGSSMSLMKKDMGGSAQAIGLALMIMSMQLPVRLRVLVGAVENSVSGDAYRPSDVIQTKKGLSVEITNTDAEGRLVLSDCLFEACKDKPELLFDFATLTGAARVALGPDLPPIYSNDDLLAHDLVTKGQEVQDPVWNMPLWDAYNDYMKSDIADLVNASPNSFGGSITAALFLQNFVEESVRWTHVDCYAWTPNGRAGQPKGGEAQSIRAIFSYLEDTYKKQA